MQSTKRTVPEIVIIKKGYPRLRKKAKKRNWKLKHMTKKEDGEDIDKEGEKMGDGKKVKKNRQNNLE